MDKKAPGKNIIPESKILMHASCCFHSILFCFCLIATVNKVKYNPVCPNVNKYANFENLLYCYDQSIVNVILFAR